ncbi:pyruvate kinase PKM isoform X3 [Sigmodon hispidus]
MEKNIQDLKFGVEQDLDMMLASFICKEADVHEVRKVVGEKSKNIKITSRMENPEVHRFDDILEASDGIVILESVIRKPYPTHAEGNNVANAILDEADCVMLSGETAKGDYPLETVRMQHLTAHDAGTAIYHCPTCCYLRNSLIRRLL